MDDVDPGEFTERTSRKASSRSLWRGALLIAAIALAAGLEARRLAEPDHDHAPDLRRMFGGERALETIKHAARVEAHRLGPLPLAISESTATPADYPVISGPVEVPSVIAERISAVLSSPKTYLWDAAQGCKPRYGVRLSFHRGDDHVDVLLCLECAMLLVDRNGAVIGAGCFDLARRSVAQALKAVFPNDQGIQEL